MFNKDTGQYLSYTHMVIGSGTRQWQIQYFTMWS